MRIWLGGENGNQNIPSLILERGPRGELKKTGMTRDRESVVF